MSEVIEIRSDGSVYRADMQIGVIKWDIAWTSDLSGEWHKDGGDLISTEEIDEIAEDVSKIEDTLTDITGRVGKVLERLEGGL